MFFEINGTKADVKNYDCNVADIFAELDEKAESAGAIIVEVWKDGKLLQLNEIEDLAKLDASSDGTVNLVVVPVTDIKISSLKSIITLIESMADSKTRDNMEPEVFQKTLQAYDGVLSADESSFVHSFAEAVIHNAPDIQDLAARLTSFLSERLDELQDPIASMGITAKKFEAIYSAMPEVSVQLQTGKDKEALETIILVIELISKTVRILPEYAKAISQINSSDGLIINNLSIEDFYTQLNSVLAEMISAFETKDSILIGDLTEYEIKPRLETFFAFVKENSKDIKRGIV